MVLKFKRRHGLWRFSKMRLTLFGWWLSALMEVWTGFRWSRFLGQRLSKYCRHVWQGEDLAECFYLKSVSEMIRHDGWPKSEAEAFQSRSMPPSLINSLPSMNSVSGTGTWGGIWWQVSSWLSSSAIHLTNTIFNDTWPLRATQVLKVRVDIWEG